MSRNNAKTSTNQALKIFLILSLAIIFGWLLMALKIVFLPMFLAIFFTFLISPAVEFLHKFKIPRSLGIVLTLAFAVSIAWLFINYFATSIIAFAEGFPKYEAQISAIVSQAKAFKNSQLNFITIDGLKSALSQISISGFVSNALNSFFNFFAYSIITIIFVIYFLTSFPLLPQKIKRAFPDQRGDKLHYATLTIASQVQKYVWAKTITSLITGASVAIPCLVFRVDFALTWGFFAFFLNLVPNIGAVLSCVAPVIVCALQYGWTPAFWLLVVLAIAMMVTGNFLEPKILGKSVDISPTTALFSLFFWGWIWGPVGMIIAVPAMAIIKFTCDNTESLKPVGVFLGN